MSVSALTRALTLVCLFIFFNKRSYTYGLDDVMLAHKPWQLNAAAQLMEMEAEPTCSLGLGYAVNGA